MRQGFRVCVSLCSISHKVVSTILWGAWTFGAVKKERKGADGYLEAGYSKLRVWHVQRPWEAAGFASSCLASRRVGEVMRPSHWGEDC